MISVLNDNRTAGLSVHAEPGVGKSIATALALRKCRQQSTVTILLQGEFVGSLTNVFRVTTAKQIEDVALELFRLLNARHPFSDH